MDYVKEFTEQSSQTGAQFVVIDTLDNNKIIAEIHTFKLIPKVFNHILSELTIAVNPNYQGQGIGKKLFKTLLKYVEEERDDIMRIELIVRESNYKAIKMYESIGFIIEGKMLNRIKSDDWGFESDIPMAWLNKEYKVDKSGREVK